MSVQMATVGLTVKVSSFIHWRGSAELAQMYIKHRILQFHNVSTYFAIYKYQA